MSAVTREFTAGTVFGVPTDAIDDYCTALATAAVSGSRSAQRACDDVSGDSERQYSDAEIAALREYPRDLRRRAELADQLARSLRIAADAMEREIDNWPVARIGDCDPADVKGSNE